MEERQSEPFGKTLLKSILGTNTSEEGTGGEHHYETRLKGKWVQLSNPDRARPKPAEGSNAQQKTRRRDQRLIKRFKQEEKFKDIVTRREKAGGKVLEAKAADESRIATAKTEHASKKDNGKPLSRRKRKQMGLEDGFDDNISYESFLPIHQLWLSYVHRLLHLIELDGTPNSQLFSIADETNGDAERKVFVQPQQISALQATLTKADLCGAPLVVSRASNPSLVGLQGLVVQETEGTFVIVNRKNRMKTISKQGSVFVLEVNLPEKLVDALRERLSLSSSSSDQYPGMDTLQVPLFGNQLTNNVQTRATKKYKQRRTVDL